MGIPFFIVFVLSIVFLSLGITAIGDFVSVQWQQETTSDTPTVAPYLSFRSDYWAMARCFAGFTLFLASLYFMGFFLYLEERESGRIMKNVKSFVKLRQFIERHQKEDARK
ncbi:hypothetical protein C6495_15755 [Candidatus Poribacteria bacterium]|nr:MAG: hypothetical protein C6495_15755 [Candidatus Poribacteria bacterium]